MFTLFLVIVYYIVVRLRESYLEFAAAEYYCADGWRSVSAMGGCLQTTNGGGADAGHWHRRTRKINGACGRCISTTRILRVAFCSFDRQCAGMYTDTARNEM